MGWNIIFAKGGAEEIAAQMGATLTKTKPSIEREHFGLAFSPDRHYEIATASKTFKLWELERNDITQCYVEGADIWEHQKLFSGFGVRTQDQFWGDPIFYDRPMV